MSDLAAQFRPEVDRLCRLVADAEKETTGRGFLWTERQRRHQIAAAVGRLDALVTAAEALRCGQDAAVPDGNITTVVK